MWCKVAVECHWWRPSSTISVGHSPTSPTCMCTTLKRINFIHVNFTVRVFRYFQILEPFQPKSPGTTRQLVCEPLLVPIASWMQSLQVTQVDRLMTHGMSRNGTCLHVDNRYYRYCWELSWSKCISPCADLCFMFVITNGLASLSQKGSVCRSNIWV